MIRDSIETFLFLLETYNRRYNGQHGEQTLDFRLFIVALVGAVLSGTVTIAFLSTAHGRALNPYMASVIGTHGFNTFAVIRVGAVGVFMAGMYWLYRYRHGLAAVVGAGLFASINLANSLWDVHIVASNTPETVATTTIATSLAIVAGIASVILFERFVGLGRDDGQPDSDAE